MVCGIRSCCVMACRVRATAAFPWKFSNIRLFQCDTALRRASVRKEATDAEGKSAVKLGIDFGTTRTVVAAVDRGNYPIITFEDPDGAQADWFPSLVAVRGEQRLYGWQAWACQQYPTFTIIRSLKRILSEAGPETILQLGHQAVPLIQVLREMASALRASLPQER